MIRGGHPATDEAERPPDPAAEPGTRIPIILAVDVEPDELQVRRELREPWHGFERMADNVRDLRPRLAEATGEPVHLSWFLRMDQQVADSYGSPSWVVDAYGARLAEFRADGDALGVHPHAWRWREPPGHWVADHGDPDWVEAAMRLSFETFQRSIGEPCLVHRFGDRFMSPRVVQVLRELGVRCDLTIEPGARAARSIHPGSPGTGRIPDQASAPRHPYRPSPEDPLRPLDGDPGRTHDDDLWMIPLTSFDGDTLMPRWRAMARRIRDRARPRHRRVSLTRAWDAQGFWRLTAAHLNESPEPYLAFALRSDAAIEAGLWGPTTAKLDALMRHPLIERLRFTTPAEALELMGT